MFFVLCFEKDGLNETRGLAVFQAPGGCHTLKMIELGGLRWKILA